jgi:multisubunit Na+/H+ antiporter MnhB subunit
MWTLIGVVAAIATIYLYILISPAYKRREKFSLPILPFLGLAFLHLFVAFAAVRYVAFGIDAVMLTWAIIARVADGSDNENS